MQNWKNKNTKIRNFMKVGKIKIQNENQEVYRKLEKNTKFTTFTKNLKKIEHFWEIGGYRNKKKIVRLSKNLLPKNMRIRKFTKNWKNKTYKNQELYQKV